MPTGLRNPEVVVSFQCLDENWRFTERDPGINGTGINEGIECRVLGKEGNIKKAVGNASPPEKKAKGQWRILPRSIRIFIHSEDRREIKEERKNMKERKKIVLIERMALGNQRKIRMCSWL